MAGLLEQATEALSAGDLRRADALATEAAAALALDGQWDGVVAALQLRNITLGMLGQVGDQGAVLQHLVGLATRQGDVGAALEARVALRALGTGLDGGAPEEWDTLLEAAADLERPDVVAGIWLIRARERLAAGDVDGAFADAKLVRHDALDRGDGVLRLNAALVIADVAEARGDPGAALIALMAARADLVNLLPEAGEAAIAQALQERRDRWGADAFEQAMAAWDSRGKR